MSKSKRKDRAESNRGWAAVRPFVIALVTLVVILGVLLGLNELGRRAGLELVSRDRFAVPFAEIACDAPPRLTREAFLEEVRTTSGIGDSLQRLDPETPAKLAAAFLTHPWVEGVPAVRIEPGGTIRVELKFRTPLLAVTVEGEKSPRFVDATGVLLPTSEANADIAILTTPVPSALDERVKRAAELVAAYRPRSITHSASGWILRLRDGKELQVER